jgi:hypothetical protein
MELTVEVKAEAPHASPRTASRDDPQECGGLRQGNIALIHSAPTGENGLLLPPSFCVEQSDEANQTPSFRDGALAPDRNLEIPGSMLRIAPE